MRDHGEIYRALSAQYGWTVTEIAQMTPAQQEMYLSGDSGGGGGKRKFATVGEARAFMAAMKGGK